MCGAAPDRAADWTCTSDGAYDNHTSVQALRRLICVCDACHLTTHLGYANVTGRADQALAHRRHVTGMIDTEVSQHVHAAGKLWTT